MRRKHRVHSISRSKSGKAMMVHTNGGSVGFAFDDSFIPKLKRFFPHLVHLFKDNPELNEFLVGRYIYGETREASAGGMVVKVLT